MGGTNLRTVLASAMLAVWPLAALGPGCSLRRSAIASRRRISVRWRGAMSFRVSAIGMNPVRESGVLCPRSPAGPLELATQLA
jgi:hypothetical protein